MTTPAKVRFQHHDDANRALCRANRVDAADGRRLLDVSGRVAQVIADAEQREREWWETRIRQLRRGAEEERYGDGPVVWAGELACLLEERAKERP